MFTNLIQLHAKLLALLDTLADRLRVFLRFVKGIKQHRVVEQIRIG